LELCLRGVDVAEDVEVDVETAGLLVV